MSKWKRPQSPSAIPRLLRNRPIASPCDNSHSPSPVKASSGSRIPTPTGTRDHTARRMSTESDATEELELKNVISNNQNLVDVYFGSFEDIEFGFVNMGMPLEEISLPSSPLADDYLNNSGNRYGDLFKTSLNEINVLDEIDTDFANGSLDNSIQENIQDENDEREYEENKKPDLIKQETPEIDEKEKEKENDLNEMDAESVAYDDFKENSCEQALSNNLVKKEKFIVRSLEDLPTKTASTNLGGTKTFLRKSLGRSLEDMSLPVQSSVKNLKKSVSLLSSKPIKSPVMSEVTKSKETTEKLNVMYITKNLIQKITKDQSPLTVSNLNLSLSKQWQRKIQFIENLEELKYLTILNLSNNIIQKIQNLSTLKNLKNLNLSSNCIVSLDGLEGLVNLEILNVNHNQVEIIPKWFSKKLRNLSILCVVGNKIKNLDEVQKLSPLTNLIEVNLADNPICQMSHYKEYAIFHLRHLDSIDNIAVTDDDRKSAVERFGKDELDAKQKQFEDLQQQYSALENSSNALQQERSEWIATEKKLNGKISNLKNGLRSKLDELNTKNKLLDNNAKELSKACEKQYNLEQELAFHKLDAKFADFLISHDDNENLMLDGGSTESAYIGKARYKSNQYASENLVLTEQQSASVASFFGKLNAVELRKNKELCAVLSEALGVDTNQREMDMEELQRKIEALQHQNEQFELLQSDGQGDLKLKKQKATDLKKTINELEVKVNECEAMLHQNDDEINDLKFKLENTNKDDDLHETYQAALNRAEEESDHLLSRLNTLHALLDDANTTLIQCYQEMRDLETKHNGETLSELKESNARVKQLEASVKKVEAKLFEQDRENESLMKLHQEGLEKRKLDQKTNEDLKYDLEKERKKMLQLLNKERGGKLSMQRIQEELQNELANEKTNVTKLTSDYANLSEQASEQIQELQEISGKLMTELNNLKSALSVKTAQKNEVIYYVKSLASDIMHEAVLREPEQVMDKTVKGALKGLRDCVHDALRHQLSTVDDFNTLKYKNEELSETMDELQKEFSDAKFLINQLKHEADMKDSNERVLKSEIVLLKEQLKENNAKHLSNLKDYDSVAHEMKDQIEIMERNFEKNNQEKEKVHRKLFKEKSLREHAEIKLNNLQHSMQEKLKDLRGQADQIHMKNQELLGMNDEMKSEIDYWKNIAEKMKTETQDMLLAKDKECEKVTENLLGELHETKNNVSALKDDFQQEVNKFRQHAEQLDKAVTDLEEKYQVSFGKEKDFKRLFGELQDVRIDIQNFASDAQKSYSLRDQLSKIEEDIDALNNEVKSQKMQDGSHKTLDDDLMPVLLKAVDQIQHLKLALAEKDKDLNASNVPRDLVDIQRKEINNLLIELKQKEDELKMYTPQQLDDGSTGRPLISSTPIHPRINHHVSNKKQKNTSTRKQMQIHHTQEPHQSNIIYHEHFIHEDIDHNGSEDRYCNVDEHKDLANRFKTLETSHLHEQSRKLMEGRDELRWELSRLESKVGDAVMRRSMSRHMSRYSVSPH